MELQEKNDNILQLSPEIAHQTWTITFTWKKKSKIVKFKNGEDVLKLADILSKTLSDFGIEHEVISEESE